MTIPHALTVHKHTYIPVQEGVFTETLKMEICGDCAGVAVEGTSITCPHTNSKTGIYNATITGSNAQQLAKTAQGLDRIDLTQEDGSTLTLLLKCDSDCKTRMLQMGTSKNVAGIVAPVLIIATVVIVAASLSILGLVCYRK